MGYDMFIENREDLSEDEGYFRANITGMPELRALMGQCGMLQRVPLDETKGYFSLHPIGMPEWPSKEEWAKDEAAAEARQQECQAWVPKVLSGICSHKLCSNDGWLVTPEECRLALNSHYNSGLSDEDLCSDRGMLRYWRKWLLFIARAERLGGFRVW